MRRSANEIFWSSGEVESLIEEESMEFSDKDKDKDDRDSDEEEELLWSPIG